jgi:threo-3-hydroxy-L-aspartate ammonia-lyase
MSHLTQEAVAIPIGYEDVRAAAHRLEPWVHRTPVMTSRTIDARCGGNVFLKCENFQKVGAFKFRGAINALLQLNEAGRRAGVVTHSSGNHAQALALAGKLLDVPVTVVMPRTAPSVKREATEGYGARVVPCEPTLADREATVAAEIEKHGLSLVHPFNDWNVIAGQGTAALELLDQVAPLDIILCPVGGGGLLSGTALAMSGGSPTTRVIGAEPARADDARRSLETGSIQPSNDPQTIADGLRTSLGPFTFAVISRHVPRIVTATEAEIVEAMRFIWERVKIVIEPSSAVPVAPLWNGQLDVKGLRVGVILSGGNVDVEPMFRALAAKFL